MRARDESVKESIIERAKDYVSTMFAQDFSGHDVHHTIRVYEMALRLAEEEGADCFVVGLAALLHDVDDAKLFPEMSVNNGNAVSFLIRESLDETIFARICTILKEVSYRGGDHRIPTTIEGKCVQDADRLDALGALGIARAFAFGGSRKRELYNPGIPPRENMTEEEYRSGNSTTVNHFYEKLFRLKDLMNTRTARNIAERRESFMRTYLDEFFAEWNGMW